ncbi:nucleoside kinase [Dictyobacter alpinus]|uniref:Nucleoside kinase n=1 Tax=Dictyobacter alpinus TaxID=2014873 RepID=A0A402BJD8_9CHLR|nr:AAA family ATPase [Dictyobacter alpinus]GCE31456.1 nucleoside kinase [Dictyobacter alpinus]
MPRVCPQCGEWCVEEPIDKTIPAVLCPFCSYAEPFVSLPLFIVTGASGAGKTVLSQHLPAYMPECVTLDTDILWGVIPATEEKNYSDYQNNLLLLAKHIAQNGRPVVLCGSTTPERISMCLQRQYFSAIHILALVCDDEVLLERLKQRPAWRGCDNKDTQKNMLDFNRWFKDQAQHTEPPMTLYDTSKASVEQTLQDTRQWIQERLSLSH